MGPSKDERRGGKKVGRGEAEEDKGVLSGRVGENPHSVRLQ